MTRILDLDDTRSHVDRLLHLDTQKADVGLDLTVGAVFRLTGPGSLDFGGSERRDAERKEVNPALRDPDDDYGWWALEAGTYLIRYNESLDLADDQIAHVLPLERLLLAGASHPGFLVDGSRNPLETLLSVGHAGCNLKENCRVSRVLILARS